MPAALSWELGVTKDRQRHREMDASSLRDFGVDEGRGGNLEREKRKHNYWHKLRHSGRECETGEKRAD